MIGSVARFTTGYADWVATRNEQLDQRTYTFSGPACERGVPPLFDKLVIRINLTYGAKELARQDWVVD